MARNILILGASYGSLLATKLLMAGHNGTLVCRRQTANLINRDGTEVRIKLRDEGPPAISRAACPKSSTRSSPPMSSLPATIWLALRCRNRNTLPPRCGF